MEIIGQITEIIYQNETNCYTIAEFTMENEITTVVGYLPFINKGDSLKLFGKYVTHQEYGEQFKIETFEKIMPQTLDALVAYLGSGTIKGVGPATAKKIVDKFGEETIAIIKMHPEKLSIVRGITKTKAIEIAEEFMEKWELWQIVGFLEKFGIGAQNSKKVYEMLGKDAVQQIEQNPYILLDITYGVDFNKIDKMAMDLGVTINDTKRIESAIKYSLTLSSNNGHTCAVKENLIKFVKDLLGVDEAGGAALVATLASYFPALDLLKEMNQKSRFLVLAFSISATFVLGDHLGFIAGVDPEMVVPMMISKMVSGITALLLANVLAPKLLKK